MSGSYDHKKFKSETDKIVQARVGGEADEDEAMGTLQDRLQNLTHLQTFQRGLGRLPKRLGKITKEAWEDYQRGLERLPKRLGSEGVWTISSRKVRCPKVFGKLGNLPREVYRNGLEIFSRGRCRTRPMIAGSLRIYVDCSLKDDEGGRPRA